MLIVIGFGFLIVFFIIVAIIILARLLLVCISDVNAPKNKGVIILKLIPLNFGRMVDNVSIKK